MFDDSIVDYMLRMQGRTMSVKMTKEVARIGETRTKEKAISQALANRLVRFRANFYPRANAERPYIRLDLISLHHGEDFEEEGETTEQFMMLSHYPAPLDIDADERLDFWRGIQGRPTSEDFTPGEGRQLGSWFDLRNGTREILEDRLADWTFRRHLRLFRMTENGGWEICMRFDDAYTRFVEAFLPNTDTFIHGMRSFVINRSVAIDYELLGKHLRKATEYHRGEFEGGLSWEAFSYTVEPSWFWRNWHNDNDTNPPFPQLLFADYLYAYDTRNGWQTHPHSQYVNRAKQDFDGEWYKYQIPNVDISSSDDDVLKDFQAFLRKKLVDAV